MTNTRRSSFSIRQELAEMIRDAYVQERASWHSSRGGKVENYRPGKQWDALWPKMADFFLKQQIDNYRAFIHQQFTVRGNLTTCPSPQQCYGPAALRKWQQKRTSIDDYSLSFRLQSQRLEDELQNYRAWMKDWSDDQVQAYVLMDHENGLTALFRYCAAIQIGRDDIASTYHYAALLQYVFGYQQYDQVWKDLITPTLKDEAAALRLAA